MKGFVLLSWALSWVLGAILALGQAYNYGVDVSRLTRRANGTVPIVVRKLPPSSNGSLPLRMEIRDMKADPYKWDLYILALSMFQDVDQDDALSYYQIAGIHGVPFQAWDGVYATSLGIPTPQAGYCPHSNVLFPTWHRPYLALFEQELYKMATAIAAMFTNSTERQLYQQAAADFRIPYWDWSIGAPGGQSHFPDVFWSPVIAQRGPNGVQNIRNPLYSYVFHPLDEGAMIWEPLREWNETKRAPNTAANKTSPPSRNDQINTMLLSKLPEIQRRLYILFSNYHDFNSFSNKAWAVSQNLSNMDSIEAVHDIIHIYGGMKGHMTYVPLSAFDPLFFLHHAMTDRLFAIWQVLNPDAWISPMAAGENTFTTTKGTMQSSSTPLTPFYASSSGDFWDSDMVRSTDVFGYAYADSDNAHNTDQQHQQALIQSINAWWGASSPAGTLSKKPSTVSSLPNEDEFGRLGKGLKSSRPNIGSDAQDPPRSRIIKDGHYTEWVANVHVNVEALDGRFGIHFFIGAPPEHGHDWETATNLVGSMAVFAMNRMTDSDSKISGAVPLTSALMKMVGAGSLRDLNPAYTVSFVHEMLKFGILDSNDEPVDPRLVNGLHIGIGSSDVRVPRNDSELPRWGRLVMRAQMWP